MALKHTWNHEDVSNRIISEPLNVEYTASELKYSISPKGTGEEPSYVTEAEEAVEDATDEIETKMAAIPTLKTQLNLAVSARNQKYSAWRNDKTPQKYNQLRSAISDQNAARAQLSSAQAELARARIAMNNAVSALEAANEKWAKESQTVEYKGGEFLGFEYHRIATMRMTYLGFTIDAAKACKAYFDSLYTRHIAKSASFEEGQIETMFMDANPNSVKVVHAEGDNYSVEIDVHEDDVHLSHTSVSPATLFTVENERTYL